MQVKEKVYAPIFTKKAVFSDYNTTIILPKLFHYEETLYYYFCGFFKKKSILNHSFHSYFHATMTFDICNIKIESHFNIVSQILVDKRAENVLPGTPSLLQLQVRHTEY